MDNEIKDLMHSVVNNRPELIPIMHQLYRYKDKKRLLRWLIANRITGANLLSWLKIDFNNSVLGMVKFIVNHYNKSRTDKAIILGRDWV